MEPKSYFRGQKYIYDIVALYRRRADLRAYLELLLSIATIGVFALMALRPTVLTISNLLTEINTKEETSKQMDQKIQNLQTAQSILSQQKNNIAILASAVPTSPDLASYVRQIEGVAKKDNVSTQDLGSQDVTLVGAPTTPATAAQDQRKPLPSDANGVNIVMSVSGDYAGVSSFLADIELLRRPLFFDSVSFTTSQIDNVKSLFLTVSGRAPYQKLIQ